MAKAYFNSENFSLRRIRHVNYSRNAWQHIVMCLPTKTVFFFNKEHVLLHYWTCQLLFVRSKFACGCPTIHSIVVVHDCGVLQSLKREPLVLYRTDYRLARKTFKYIGLLIALLKRSNTNKNTIFYKSSLFIIALGDKNTSNAKPAWQYTIESEIGFITKRNLVKLYC